MQFDVVFIFLNWFVFENIFVFDIVKLYVFFIIIYVFIDV